MEGRITSTSVKGTGGRPVGVDVVTPRTGPVVTGDTTSFPFTSTLPIPPSGRMGEGGV